MRKHLERDWDEWRLCTSPSRAALLVVLFWPCYLQATGREVWVDGSVEETGNGSESRPFKTISAGVRSASPGDTVFVRAFRGVYDEWLPFSDFQLRGGEVGRRLRIVGVQGTPVVRPSVAQQAGFVVRFGNSRAHNVHIENFVLDGAHTVARAGGEPGRCIEIQSGARDISVANCWIVNAPGHGIFCSELHDSEGVAENCTFQNLKVMFNGKYGVYIKADHCTVSNSTIAFNHDYGIHLWGGVSQGQTPDDCIIVGNRIYNNSRPSRDNHRSGILVKHAKRARVFNNIVTDETNGIRISDDVGSYVAHNTVVNCRSRGIYVAGSMGDDSRVTQNICFRNGSNSDLDNYFVLETRPPYGRHLNWVSRDPMFVTGILGTEYRLSPKSPCRDATDFAGNALVPYVAFDIDGLQRDAHPDFGADEYGQIRQKIRRHMLSRKP